MNMPLKLVQAFRGETGIQDQFSFIFCIIISWKTTTLPPTMYKTNEEANKSRKSLIGYDKDKVSGQVCLRLSTHRSKFQNLGISAGSLLFRIGPAFLF